MGTMTPSADVVAKIVMDIPFKLTFFVPEERSVGGKEPRGAASIIGGLYKFSLIRGDRGGEKAVNAILK